MFSIPLCLNCDLYTRCSLGIDCKSIGHILRYILAIHTAHAGIMLNAIMPLRIGDIYKVMFIGRTGKFTHNKSLVALGFERLLDLIILYSFFLITLFMIGKPDSVPVNLFGQNIPKTFISNSFDSLAIIIIILVFILLFLQSRFVMKFFDFRLFQK